jgi:hypothetical protein
VVTFVKRDLECHPKLTQHGIDFDKPETYENLVGGRFLLRLTTIKTGDQSAFRKVDYEYPRQFTNTVKIF